MAFAASGFAGLYAVAVQVEDFASPNDTVAMSSIPVQFIVSVFTSTEACTSSPLLASPTRVGDSCVAVPFNSTYSEGVTAESGGTEVRLAKLKEGPKLHSIASPAFMYVVIRL